MLTLHATEQINEVSRTRTTITRTTPQVITRYFGRCPQTTKAVYVITNDWTRFYLVKKTKKYLHKNSTDGATLDSILL